MGGLITEGTTLANPYWQYSRDKIACEEFLMKMYREEGFPITIVRPSHTYDERNIPLGVHGKNGFWQVIKRMQEGKPVIIQGDGTSLWHLTFNRDFAVGFTGLMGNRHATGDVYGYDFTGSLIGDKSTSVVFDNSKLKKIVPEMTTRIPFNQGVRIALDYISKHSELQVEDLEFDAWCDRVIDALENAKACILK